MLAAAVALPTAACEAPGNALAKGSAIVDARPALKWAPVEGAKAYRVRLLSRVPNGRIVAASDTVVEAPEFVPPKPLAEQRAKVTLRVRAICGKEESAETVSWFLIDTSAACRMGEVKVSAAGVAWEAVTGAKSYEVRRYAIVDGRLLGSAEVKGNSFAIPTREGAVVSVRPACVGGLGEAVYRVVVR